MSVPESTTGAEYLLVSKFENSSGLSHCNLEGLSPVGLFKRREGQNKHILALWYIIFFVSGGTVSFVRGYSTYSCSCHHTERT